MVHAQMWLHMAILPENRHISSSIGHVADMPTHLFLRRLDSGWRNLSSYLCVWGRGLCVIWADVQRVTAIPAEIERKFNFRGMFLLIMKKSSK